jgi:poly(3-hydroxybutyrate) depolymerase
MCGTTGMLTPMLRCSPEHPCTNILESYSNPHVTDPPLSGIDFPSFVPACTTTDRGSGLGRGMYDDGPPLTWNDSDGVTRYRCEYRPAGTSVTSKKPLLLFVHGSGGYAYSVYDTTSLRDKAPDFDVTGDPSRPGFILVAAQGRNLHWPTTQPQDGAKHDTFFRDLASPSANRDIAYYDHIIDSLVTEGVVDADRIFISGWSNGARFAALYGIARHDTPTPGGNRIAAVANYSGGDPFSNGHHGQVPSCQQAVYPTSAVPFLLISRTCDAIACNEAQDRGFRDAGAETSPGNVAESWVQTLRSQVANPNVTWIPITRNAVSVAEGTCASAALCSPIGAFLNHLHWPDGVEDQTGVDLEPVMLQFMKDHPLD